MGTSALATGSPTLAAYCTVTRHCPGSGAEGEASCSSSRGTAAASTAPPCPPEAGGRGGEAAGSAAAAAVGACRKRRPDGRGGGASGAGGGSASAAAVGEDRCRSFGDEVDAVAPPPTPLALEDVPDAATAAAVVWGGCGRQSLGRHDSAALYPSELAAAQVPVAAPAGHVPERIWPYRSVPGPAAASVTLPRSRRRCCCSPLCCCGGCRVPTATPPVNGDADSPPMTSTPLRVCTARRRAAADAQAAAASQANSTRAARIAAGPAQPPRPVSPGRRRLVPARGPTRRQHQAASAPHLPGQQIRPYSSSPCLLGNGWWPCQDSAGVAASPSPTATATEAAVTQGSGFLFCPRCPRRSHTTSHRLCLGEGVPSWEERA